MRKKLAIGGILVVALLIATVFFGVIPSLSVIDTETQIHSYHFWGPASHQGDMRGVKITEGNPTGELVHPVYYISSWNPGEYSQNLNVQRGGFQIDEPFGRGVDPVIWLPLFRMAYIRVIHHGLDGSETTLIDRKFTHPDVEWTTPPGDGAYPHPWGGPIWGSTYPLGDWVQEYLCANNSLLYDGRQWGSVIDGYSGILDSQSRAFRLKGTRLGYLEIELINDVAWWYDRPVWNDRSKCIENQVLLHDEVELKSGTGDISLVPGQWGAGMYEEGENLDFDVSTGFSGAVGDDGWKISVKDSFGNPATLTMMGGDGTPYTTPFTLRDNLDVYRVTWTIPEGTWVPGSYNMWTFILENTIIEQDREYTFIIKEGAGECTPSAPVIDFSPNPAEAGLPIILTITAEANDEVHQNCTGTGVITEFWVNVYRLGSEAHALPGYPKWITAISSGGLTYTCEDIFTWYENELIEVISHAFDGQNVGPRGYRAVPLSDPSSQEYSITVAVYLDDKLINAATVSVGGSVPSQRTNSYGSVTFYSLPPAIYTVRASHRDASGSVAQTIDLVDSNQEISLYLTGGINIIAILALVIILAIFGILSLVLPFYNPFFRLVIFIIGVIVAIVSYLFFSGIIYFI